MDGFFLCQRIAFGKYKTPDIRLRKDEGFIFSCIRDFGQYREVQQTFVKLFRNLLRVPAGNVVMEVRVRLFECMDLAGEKTDLVGFCQAEIKITTRDIIQ